MKFYFNPKAEVGMGYFQFGLSGKKVFDGSVDVYGRVPWRLGGWYWPMGFFVKIGPINFTWYTKKLLKTRNKVMQMRDHWRWYGAITFNGWRE